MDTLAQLVILMLAAGTPLVFAALGELVTEKSGVLNLGVEGMMLVGAVVAFMVAATSGSPWLGIAAGMGDTITNTQVEHLMLNGVGDDQGFTGRHLIQGIRDQRLQYLLHIHWIDGDVRKAGHQVQIQAHIPFPDHFFQFV